MNRLISTNLEDVTPDRLPPLQREPGRTRMLFLTATFLGFGNLFRLLSHYTARRDDIDAVHIELKTPLWLKVLGKSAPFHTRGWDLHPHRHLFAWRRIIQRWLRGPLAIDRFDVVHITTQGNALASIDFKPGSPTVFAVNLDATAVDAVNEFNMSPLAFKPFIEAERKIFQACDFVVCRNDWCSRSLRENYHLPEQKIVIARNAIVPPEITRMSMPAREENMLPRLVFVGNAFRRKGGRELLDAHQRLWSDRAELHIFSNRVRPDHTKKNVIWHRNVSRDDLMRQWLPQMDIFVMPTSSDMHPWAILEAASVGLPVVSTNLAGIPEMVRHNETGLLCSVRDWNCFERSVQTLLDDEARRDAMGRAARDHILTNYNADKTYNHLLDRLIEQSRKLRAEHDPTSRPEARQPAEQPAHTHMSERMSRYEVMGQ